MFKESLGLAFGEEPETLWSILSKLAQVLKYCNTELRTVVIDLLLEHVCAGRANSLPKLLADKHTRAVAVEKRATLQLLSLSGKLQQNSAVQQLVARLRLQQDSNDGLARRFKIVYDAVNIQYPATGAAAAQAPNDTSARTKTRNKYVLLLEQLRAAEEAVRNNLPTAFNATKIREELAK